MARGGRRHRHRSGPISGHAMNPTPDEVAAGHAFYTSRSLAIYDLAILGYFSRLAWRCPAGRVLRQYDDHVTANHLDIGVGTGYFLDRRRFPSPSLLVLMDLNEACLTKAGERLARYQPVRHSASVLEPIRIDGPAFDPISMTYVLHGLPGDMGAKAAAFEHIKAAARPGRHRVRRNPVARWRRAELAGPHGDEPQQRATHLLQHPRRPRWAA